MDKNLSKIPLFYLLANRLKLSIPLYSSSIKAGFPSPADDYIEKTLDFNELLVQHPVATFCLRVSGNSMIGAGIHDGDLLVVDRSITPKNKHVIIAMLDGELTVKRLIKKNNKVILVPENPEYQPIEVSTEASFEIWGVVTNVIHNIR